jgi:hypothetical protein
MRAFPSVVLCLALSLAAGAAGAEADTPKPAKPPVNTICPVDGAKVDPSIPPIAGKTKEGKTVMIAVSSAACAEKVRAKPEDYADDAVANRQHAAGR